MSFIAYIKSRKFFLNLLLVLVTAFLIVFGTVRFLDSWTEHGEYVEVPDLVGKKTTALAELMDDQPVSYQIVDSIYDPKGKPGIVLRQDPEPGTHVKHNRSVYLYVTNVVPPQIAMPKLIDRSERQARLILETYGLRTGKMEEIEADCNGCILAQRLNGKDIEPGSPVKKGSVIDLEIGRKGPFLNAGSDTTGTSE
jgi:eukaryotic-like serine/threonine-protein kinase